jgi:thymidylate synthase
MNKEHLHPDGRPYTKEEFVEKIKTDKEFAKRFGNLGKIYGHQWRTWNDNIDQISELIRLLKENPDSRRMVVNAWSVHDLPKMVLPPCHYGFQVYTRELSLGDRKQIFEDRGYVCDLWPFNGDWHGEYDGFGIPRRAISLMWNQRSCDVPLGIPMNIASYGLLLEIIAKLVNMVPDELIGNLGDCHIYLNQIEGTKEQIGREPFELPKLNINTEFWPYESGECGVGPIDSTSVLNSFNDDNFCKCLLNDDIQLSNYQYHPKIYFPLSN